MDAAIERNDFDPVDVVTKVGAKAQKANAKRQALAKDRYPLPLGSPVRLAIDTPVSDDDMQSAVGRIGLAPPMPNFTGERSQLQAGTYLDQDLDAQTLRSKLAVLLGAKPVSLITDYELREVAEFSTEQLKQVGQILQPKMANLGDDQIKNEINSQLKSIKQNWPSGVSPTVPFQQGEQVPVANEHQLATPAKKRSQSWDAGDGDDKQMRDALRANAAKVGGSPMRPAGAASSLVLSPSAALRGRANATLGPVSSAVFWAGRAKAASNDDPNTSGPGRDQRMSVIQKTTKVDAGEQQRFTLASETRRAWRESEKQKSRQRAEEGVERLDVATASVNGASFNALKSKQATDIDGNGIVDAKGKPITVHELWELLEYPAEEVVSQMKQEDGSKYSVDIVLRMMQLYERACKGQAPSSELKADDSQMPVPPKGYGDASFDASSSAAAGTDVADAVRPGTQASDGGNTVAEDDVLFVSGPAMDHRGLTH